ncbi:hypothetical protein DPMN_189598 [Dreissena polymorpha]|uniref:Uncharacterized protein n=1 Tax=Dreissena polymorpha TaxID=45954 RepID=A0A9D4DTG0_DREPO|nr:hypothetical protein DPMN_189598 [Dreissena polymorpha]
MARSHAYVTAQTRHPQMVVSIAPAHLSTQKNVLNSFVRYMATGQNGPRGLVARLRVTWV